MVRELCWISLAKRVVINRMTFGNNYQPSSLHPSFPPSFSSHTHLSLCPSPSPSHSILPRWGQGREKEKRRERNELRIGGKAGPCCCCLGLQGELNFQIRLICWKWDWPTAFPLAGRQAGQLSTKRHVPFHVILEPTVCCAGWGHRNAVSSAGFEPIVTMYVRTHTHACRASTQLQAKHTFLCVHTSTIAHTVYAHALHTNIIASLTPFT